MGKINLNIPTIFLLLIFSSNSSTLLKLSVSSKFLFFKLVESNLIISMFLLFKCSYFLISGSK